jgi:cytidylate kinase
MLVMQVICISKGTFSGGKELAEILAKKLGYACLSREELIESAVKEGIQVGKLEMTMIKPRAFSERLAAEKEHYLAFCTAYLCERAIEGGIVYHGRTGHLLLPGISHVLRVRVVAGKERRIRLVMNEMGVERSKAQKYVEDVDMDRQHWVRSMYGVSVDEAINYDIIINLEQMSVENAASALIGVSQLPDFQMTPASKKAMMDLRLGAKARLELARDERTYKTCFKVRADSGVVTVNYLPQDSKLAEFIPDVLRKIPDIMDVRSTMAMTNILWIQEEYKPHSNIYDKVVEIATKWNAAVELLRLAPEHEKPLSEKGVPLEPDIPVTEEAASGGLEAYNGGIEEDGPDLPEDDGGLKPTLDELASIGKSGGGRSVHGGQQKLLSSIDRTIPYTLVVIGDVFKSKGHSARLRATRDLSSFLSDRIKAPVVTADEIGSQFLFGKRDIIRTLAFLALAFAIYSLILTHQQFILEFLANSGWYAEAVKGTFLARLTWMPKIVVSLVVLLAIPVIAFSYGNVTGAILKLIKME